MTSDVQYIQYILVTDVFQYVIVTCLTFLRYDFTLTEDEEHNQYVLDVSVPRFMDLSLLEADVQPTYVRLVIKGKVGICVCVGVK